MEVNAILAYWMDAPLAIALLMATGAMIGLSGSQVDELVWGSMAARPRKASSARAAT